MESEREHIRTRREARTIYWSWHDRDSYECPQCGELGAIEVHHRDGDPFNNHLGNLLGLCHNCHRQEHRRRNTEARIEKMKTQFEALAGGDEAALAGEPQYTGMESAH